MTENTKLPVDPEEEKSVYEAISLEDSEKAPTKLSKERVGEVPSRNDKVSTERGDITQRLLAISQKEAKEKERLERDINTFDAGVADLERSLGAVDERILDQNYQLFALLSVEYLYLSRLGTCLKQQCFFIDKDWWSGPAEKAAGKLKKIRIDYKFEPNLLRVPEHYNTMGATGVQSIGSLKKIQASLEQIYREKKAELSTS
jgi:hypothetical protein